MAPRSQYGRLFEQFANEHRQKLLEALAQGQPHDQYLILVGQAQGLVLGLQISEEVDFRLSGEG
jgi:hypothetical protein